MSSGTITVVFQRTEAELLLTLLRDWRELFEQHVKPVCVWRFRVRRER
jgi:hypothetical protein